MAEAAGIPSEADKVTDESEKSDESEKDSKA